MLLKDQHTQMHTGGKCQMNLVFKERKDKRYVLFVYSLS